MRRVQDRQSALHPHPPSRHPAAMCPPPRDAPWSGSSGSSVPGTNASASGGPPSRGRQPRESGPQELGKGQGQHSLPVGPFPPEADTSSDHEPGDRVRDAQVHCSVRTDHLEPEGPDLLPCEHGAPDLDIQQAPQQGRVQEAARRVRGYGEEDAAPAAPGGPEAPVPARTTGPRRPPATSMDRDSSTSTARRPPPAPCAPRPAHGARAGSSGAAPAHHNRAEPHENPQQCRPSSVQRRMSLNRCRCGPLG